MAWHRCYLVIYVKDGR